MYTNHRLCTPTLQLLLSVQVGEQLSVPGVDANWQEERTGLTCLMLAAKHGRRTPFLERG